MAVQKPAFIIKLPGNIIFILFGIWLTGFIFVFLWNMVNHLIFRRQILKNTREIRNPEILRYWERELDYARIKYQKYKLVTSDNVKTPLSIGLFRRSIYVVLPHKNYTEEARFKYASLILETTGDQRGFTTCLSASAKTLKYRLKNITKPKKTYSGAITVGILTFLLFISCGYVTLAYGTYSGADLIYHGEDSSMYLLSYIISADFEDKNGETYTVEYVFNLGGAIGN